MTFHTMPNAPFFTVTAIDDGTDARGIEIYAGPCLATVLDHGRGVTLTVCSPHATAAPGIIESYIDYAEFHAGDALTQEEVDAWATPWVRPRPLSIDRIADPNITDEGFIAQVRVQLRIGSVVILLSETEVMVVPQDVLGFEMAVLMLSLNADGSETTPGDLEKAK